MFYTYAHIRNDTGKVFYIGKGKDDRWCSQRGRSAWWRRTVKKAGFTPMVLARWKTEEEAFDHEKFLIACYRDMGVPLCNISAGGEGPSGLRHTAESRARIGAASRAQPRSAEWRAKISAALKGKNKGHRHTEEHKALIAFLGMGRKASEESRARMRTAQARRKASAQ